MVNKIKGYFIFVMILSLVACSNANKVGLEGQQQIDDSASKADFKKAALLNIELGQRYLEQGQISRAKKKLVHALELAPKLPEAHTTMGYFFETVGDNTMAEKYYRKAIFLAKSQGVFHNNYGVFLCGQARYKEADKEFLIATKDYNYSKTAEAYENAGLCALKANDATKAEGYFKIAVRYDPKQVNSLMELAELSFNKEEIQQASYYLEKLRAQSEPTARILWLAIRIAMKTNDKDALASNALLLKNLFKDSQEYKLYLIMQEEG